MKTLLTALILALTLNLASANSSTNEKSVNFYNFDKAVSLTENKGIYHLANRNLSVKIGARLIIGINNSPSALKKTKKTLEDIPSHTYLKEAFLGEKKSYYIAGFNSTNNAISAMQALHKISAISSIQPDILQIDNAKPHTHTHTHTPHKNKDHNHDHHPTSAQHNTTKIKEPIINYIKYLEDIGVPTLQSDNLGENIKIAVIDDGFNLEHHELSHVYTSFAYDVDTGNTAPSPTFSQGIHGTKVIGIIFSRSKSVNENQAAGPKTHLINGIAPNASLIAIKHTDTWTSKTLIAFQLAKLSGADLVNCSWQSPWLLEPISDAVQDLAVFGRDKKGTAVIFAAGNQGQEIRPQSTESAIEPAITVGAYDSHFSPLKSSNFGDAVDLYSYGSRAKTPNLKGKYGILSGTSLAAAVTTGISALLLSKNPEMSLSDLEQKLKDITQAPTENKTPPVKL